MIPKTDPNPGGLPIETVDGIRAGSIADRAQLYRDLADGPFLASNRPGAKVPRGVRDNFWLQRMQPGHRNAYERIAVRLVAAGTGVALVPRLAAQPPRARLLPLHPRVQRHHFALTRSSATSDSGIRRIVELLEEHAARLLADPALPTDDLQRSPRSASLRGTSSSQSRVAARASTRPRSSVAPPGRTPSRVGVVIAASSAQATGVRWRPS